jgi:DNA-directed RNA polymerase specialized sigma24 family protein
MRWRRWRATTLIGETPERGCSASSGGSGRQHCERAARGREAITALAAHRQLGDDETEDISARIDAQRTARELLAGWAGLSDLERAAVELVDLTGLEPREAASVLGISAGALRVRLFGARKRLGRPKENR